MNDEVRYFKVSLEKLEVQHQDFVFGEREYEVDPGTKEMLFQSRQDELYLLAATALLFDESVSDEIKQVIRTIFFDMMVVNCDREKIKDRFANVMAGYYEWH